MADCGFSEIESVLKSMLSRMRLPAFLVYPASLCARLLYGVSYREMRPIDSLSENRVPILFIHGEKDDFIPPAHSLAMQRATPGYSEICLIHHASHAISILTAPAEYRKAVSAFLHSIGILHPEEKGEETACI